MRRLVMSPLKWEYDLLVKSLEELGYRAQRVQRGIRRARGIQKPQSSQDISVFGSLNVICAYGGHGKVDFALKTYDYLKEYDEIEEVVVVGACGALNRELLNLGDVVIGVETIEHDYKEKFMGSGEPPKFFPHPHWLMGIKNKLVSHCFFGVIASGDEDIVSQERALKLRKDTAADVVAWEGAGGARACQLAQVNFIEIRGVTDMAGKRAPEEFKKNLPHTVKNLARILVEVPFKTTT